MREFKKRRNRHGELMYLVKRTLFVFVLFGITTLAVNGAWGMYGKFHVATKAESLTRAEHLALLAQEAHVGKAVQGLSSDRGVEVEMRDRFGVAKAGELAIYIVRTQSASSTPPVPPSDWKHGILRSLHLW